MVDETPFFDVLWHDGGFSLPELKWRELLFVGALRQEASGECFVRDASRPLPPFQDQGLFPEGVRFRALRRGSRVLVLREPAVGDAGTGAGLPV